MLTTTHLTEFGELTLNTVITAEGNGSTRPVLSVPDASLGSWLKQDYDGPVPRLQVFSEAKKVGIKKLQEAVNKKLQKGKRKREHESVQFPLREVLKNLEDKANDREVKRSKTDPQAYKDYLLNKESDRLTSLANTEGWCE